MSSRGPIRPSRVLLLLALAVPAVLTGWWFSTRQAHVASSYDEALDRALAPVMAQREVQSKLGATSPTQARLLARALAQSSIQYLAPRDLELWQQIRSRVALASPAVCARLWKGGPTDFLGPAIAALGDEALDAYTEMLGRALALRFERKPPPEASPGAVERGLAEVSALLPAEARGAFEADVKRRDLPDARACELFLAIASASEKLEPTARTDFLRALAKELQAPPL